MRFAKCIGDTNTGGLAQMYADTIEGFTKAAEKKLAALRQHPGGFFVSSMMAGAYVGIGIILIFTLGSQVPPEFQKLVMGATFGIALTLVVIAGAELYTGHTMFMALRGYRGLGGLGDIGASWGMTWIGNLAGALALVALFALGGGGGLLGAPDTLVMKVAAAKMNAPALPLFARAILCNWLVCLALWMSARVNSDSAKCIVIFWCLLAFIACGFEHSVANMTLLGLALAGNHPESVSLGGFAWNLAWVTLGNAVGGAVFVAGAYHVSTYGFPAPVADKVVAAESK
ncbi:MAG TPA: formate/nitrite transporter family protein [Burkholderiales bacterium]|jgi:nitrite transporter NirC